MSTIINSSVVVTKAMLYIRHKIGLQYFDFNTKFTISVIPRLCNIHNIFYHSSQILRSSPLFKIDSSHSEPINSCPIKRQFIKNISNLLKPQRGPGEIRYISLSVCTSKCQINFRQCPYLRVGRIYCTDLTTKSLGSGHSWNSIPFRAFYIHILYV